MREVINTKDKRPAITEEQLFDTCDTYVEQYGKEPSQQVIKDLIGGSPVTIGPLLRAWKEKKKSDEQAILEMPDYIRDSGMAIIATWWKSIQPTINDMITAAQTLAEEKIGKAETELRTAITEQVWLEKENSKLETATAKDQQKLEALERKLDRLERKYAKEYKEHAAAKIKLAKFEWERDALNQPISQHTTTSKTDNTLKE